MPPRLLPPTGRRAALLAAALVGGGLLLVACGRSDPPLQLVCPRPGIVNGLDQTAGFRPGGGGEGDLRWVAVMQNIDGGCSYDDGLTVNLSVDLLAEAGPAHQGAPVELPYFVAVAGPDGEILDKQAFTAVVSLPPGTPRGGTRESFTQRYPAVTPAEGALYRIYLGFDVPRDEALRRRVQLR
ncbi:MAG TPA: hypothetical protein VFG43_13435 [Geminicoccaceae bacterium]|nr:hypothetical protein [Geminicoccaceae bacterium]